MDASIVDVFEAKSTKLMDMVHGKTEAFTILPELTFCSAGEARVHYVQTKGDNLRRISVGFPSTSPMLELLHLDAAQPYFADTAFVPYQPSAATDQFRIV